VIEDALGELLSYLKARGYQFTTITPASHAKVLARHRSGQPTLRDIFGWSRPFESGDLDPELRAILDAANALKPVQGGYKSAYRVSNLGDDLFLHSSYPTDSTDSVFFGPDTYRFARFVSRSLEQLGQPSRILDMGAGTGAGGIGAAKLTGSQQVILVDTNPAALSLARVNAEAAGVSAELVETDRVSIAADLILANPPYMMDRHGRDYRDGGGLLGGEVALDWVQQALALMPSRGSMLLYTGAAVVDGRIPLLTAIAKACSSRAEMCVEELDPDVFGEELSSTAYQQVERIAALGVTIRKC
jgi:methylase of polypeptide subunit release factors